LLHSFLFPVAFFKKMICKYSLLSGEVKHRRSRVQLYTLNTCVCGQYL